MGITTTHQRERPLDNDLWRVNTLMFTVKIWASRGLWVVVNATNRVVGEFFTQVEAREFASRCYRDLDRGYIGLVA